MTNTLYRVASTFLEDHCSRRNERDASAGPRVAAIATPNALTLPAWFSAAQASAVLRLKSRSFVLIAGAQGIARVASRDRLAGAPADQSVTGSAVPLGPGITPSTPVAVAVRRRDAHGTDHAAVVVGGAVLGIVTREAAVRALAFEPGSAWIASPAAACAAPEKDGARGRLAA